MAGLIVFETKIILKKIVFNLDALKPKNLSIIISNIMKILL
jgi:hypothetical protein